MFDFFNDTFHIGARCSSVKACVRGHQIDPSWWSQWAISHYSKYSMTGVLKAMVCAILYVG